MQDHSTSRSLLDRARSQDQEAWQRLIYLYAPLIQHWCHRRGVHGADADDIRQEVFQKVAEHIETFRHDRPGDTFRGWLRMITHRKILDLVRRRGRQPLAQGGSNAHGRMLQLPDLDEAPAEESSEEVKRLHHRALELVRGEFEDRTWQAFWRTAVEGHAPADVAQDMGMSPAGVRKAKSRVLRRLKEELGELLA